MPSPELLIRPSGVVGWFVTQVLEGPFSALESAILQTKYYFAASVEIYKIPIHIHRSKLKIKVVPVISQMFNVR